MILTKNMSSAYAVQRRVADTLLRHDDVWVNGKCVFHQMKEILGNFFLSGIEYLKLFEIFRVMKPFNQWHTILAI